MKIAASLAIILTLLVSCTTMDMAVKGDVPPAEKETLLRERIAELWKLMIAEDWFKVYTYYDPFFRAKITKEGFMQGKGILKYYSFTIENIEMKGNIADVKVKVNCEAPKLEVGAKTTSLPRQDRVLEERWLWIYDNWFKEFQGGATRDSFTRY